jgi:transcriptional regulator with XRE-family HTH domain
MIEPAVVIGRRIKTHRDQMKVSQSALADELGVTQTAVSYWEAGRRLPGVDDLMKIAAFLGTSLVELLPADLDERPIGAVLRAVADQVDNHALADALERFADAAATAAAPVRELSVHAAGARDSAEQLLALAKLRGAPPVDVASLAARCGVRVLDFDFGGMVDGLVVQLGDGPAVGLDNAHTNPHRRRFTLAHELGHYLLRHSSSFQVDFAEDGSTGDAPGYNWQHERAANEFAANLLMPADLVRRSAERNQDITKLATMFDVSRQAMAFRLTSLGLRSGPLE